MIALARSPLVVYQLHFERPVGRCRHYVGSTMEHLLHRRLQAHANARGALLTQRAARMHVRMVCVDVTGILSRADEHRIKAAGHYERRCGICRGEMTIDEAFTLPSNVPLSPPWEPLQYSVQQPERPSLAQHREIHSLHRK